jgi:hypothetical protein
VDERGKALLLEVNTHPSFAWDTGIDATIKRPAMAGCMAIVCGQSIHATLPNITEFKGGGALSLLDGDGLPKLESLRRNLSWVQDLYTEIKFPNSKDHAHAALGPEVGSIRHATQLLCWCPMTTKIASYSVLLRADRRGVINDG